MKHTRLILAILLIIAFSVFAIASGEGESETVDQGSGTASLTETSSKTETSEDDSILGDCSVVIDSSRMAKADDGKDIIIVTYYFTNVSSEKAIGFNEILNHDATQGDVQLSEAVFVAEDVEYEWENATKPVNKGETVKVEVAYRLESSEDVVITLNEWVSWDYKVITKTFSIK